PKNLAGEYRQLRQDFKTSDTPSCYGNGHAAPGASRPLLPPGRPSMARLYPDVQRKLGTTARNKRLDGHSAPAVGGPGGPDQHVAQVAQLGRRGPFVERRGDILRSASHLVNAIR